MTSLARRLYLVKSRGATFAAALLLTAASASTAKGATITLNRACLFVNAVTSINTQHTQAGCTPSGTYGSNDTINVPNGNFTIDVSISIARSMRIHGSGKYSAYLQTTGDFYSQAIHITNASAVVKMDNLTLTANVANNDVGIMVEGEDDTNLNDNNLELNYVVVSNFGGAGIENFGGRVLVQHALIYLNTGYEGGGVANVNGWNGTVKVATFVAKNSAISENTAWWGGGVWSNGRLDLESTLLQYNHSVGDGTNGGNGGAVYVAALPDVPSPSCKVGRDTAPGSPPSEFDGNVADYLFGIMYSEIPCSLNDSIASGNLPVGEDCSSWVSNCP